jgi:hypothetical protein
MAGRTKCGPHAIRGSVNSGRAWQAAQPRRNRVGLPVPPPPATLKLRGSASQPPGLKRHSPLGAARKPNAAQLGTVPDV